MIENKIDNEAKKLLSDDLTSADSEKEVKNWFIISIVVSVVAVSKINIGAQYIYWTVSSQSLLWCFLKNNQLLFELSECQFQ